MPSLNPAAMMARCQKAGKAGEAEVIEDRLETEVAAIEFMKPLRDRGEPKGSGYFGKGL